VDGTCTARADGGGGVDSGPTTTDAGDPADRDVLSIAIEPETADLVSTDGSMPEQALRFYRRASDFRPDDADAAIAQVELLRELGRGDEGLEVLARVPEDADVLYTLGVLQRDLGRMAAAGATWQRLASLKGASVGPGHAWLTALLADILELGDKAIDWYARVEGEFKPRADLRRAVLLAERGEVDRARALISGVRGQAPGALVEQSWLVQG